MKFISTPLEDAYTIELEKIGDDRGFFARFFCVKEFREKGLSFQVKQINNSLSRTKGTLRGMHYQLQPNAETKVVRCLTGSLYDVILDIRPDSATFGKWHAEKLTPDNRKMMLVPKGFAHGFLTLEKDTEVLYLVDEFYAPDSERGIRWNDPEFNIEWPLEPAVISEKDRKHPDFNPDHHLS